MKGTKEMAIKYYVNEKKRQVIGIIDHTEWDAYNKIDKMVKGTNFVVIPDEKYKMPSRFKIVVTCDPSDKFDVEIGKEIAKTRVLRNYYAALDKRIAKFVEDAELLNRKVFQIPE